MMPLEEALNSPQLFAGNLASVVVVLDIKFRVHYVAVNHLLKPVCQLVIPDTGYFVPTTGIFQIRKPQFLVSTTLIDRGCVLHFLCVEKL
jgi:hypothetical protein